MTECPKTAPQSFPALRLCAAVAARGGTGPALLEASALPTVRHPNGAPTRQRPAGFPVLPHRIGDVRGATRTLLAPIAAASVRAAVGAHAAGPPRHAGATRWPPVRER